MRVGKKGRKKETGRGGGVGGVTDLDFQVGAFPPPASPSPMDRRGVAYIAMS